MLALGIRGDQPPDPEQPPLVDGIHLRWAPAEQEFGFPWHGFYLFRRESVPTQHHCLSKELRGVQPQTLQSVRLRTKLGALSSPRPLLLTDDFAPAGTVETDVGASLLFELPTDVTARQVDVRIGFRAGEAARTCVDFRPLPLGSGPNPRTEEGAVFTIQPLVGPPSAAVSIGEWSGGPHGLQGASRFTTSVRIEIALPCLATRVDLLLSNPTEMRVEGFNSAGVSVGSQSFKAMALHSGEVRLSGTAITRVVIESAGLESALLHEICWECPRKGVASGRDVFADLRKLPWGQHPNPFTADGVRFQLIEPGGDGLASFVPIVNLPSQPWNGAQLRGRMEIQLPCVTDAVTLQVSDPAVHIQAFRQDGTLASDVHGTSSPASGGVVRIEGSAITRLVIRASNPDSLLYTVACTCAGGPKDVNVRAVFRQPGANSVVLATATVHGDGGEVVAVSLVEEGINAIEIDAGNVALVELCYIPVSQSPNFGWEEVPNFQYPLCLPAADPGYPCPSKPATAADAQTLALSRVTYPAPQGWDQGFPQLHDSLVTLVQGGPSGGSMASRKRIDLAGQPLSPATQESPKLPELRPLDLVLLASLHPAFAQMVGLYFVDQSVPPDVGYDYLLLADTAGRLGGSQILALEWIVSSFHQPGVDIAMVTDQKATTRPPIAPPGEPRAYALPGMATREIDGAMRNDTGNAGLWWPLPPDSETEDPGRIIFHYPKRAFRGLTEPPAEALVSDYKTLGPLLVSVPDTPVTPQRSSDWPPSSVPLHLVDSGLEEGWYSYRIAGQDLFGRRSPLGVSAKWYQWTPPPDIPPPWYYKPQVGDGSIHTFAVALLDKVPPPAPLGVEAWALDPLDRWLFKDQRYADWRAKAGELRVGLRVRWRWTQVQQLQAPDTREFRIYYQSGRWNAVLGKTETVTAASPASPVESDVTLDFADSHAPGTYAGARLRVGNSDFAILGSQPGAKLRLRVKNIGPNKEIRPAEGKLCTIAIPEKHKLWVDTGVPKSWKRRLASVPYDPPAGIVVDASKDMNGLVLSETAFKEAKLATQIAVNGMTVQLPAPADLSGIQPWIDHFQIGKTLPAIPIVRFDATARTVTLASAPAVPSTTSWILGRPAREYDVFIDDAPDTGNGHPFEPSLAEPSVYAQIAVSAADDKPHVADMYPGESRTGNESRLSPSATIYRVLWVPPEPPELPELPDRLIATPADYHDRSYTTFRFIPKEHLRIHILRALDESLFERDWLIRETRAALNPVLDPKAEDAKTEHLAFFPDGWTPQRRKDAADLIDALATGGSYDSLSPDAQLVLALLPGNEAQPDYNALKQRDALMRRIRGPLPSADPEVFPFEVADPNAYRALPDNALRHLAALPGNEAVFTQVTVEPLAMSDPTIQDQRRPDDAATYTTNSTVRAYMDTLPGRATNRYFYRAMFLDGAQNQSALSPPGPPVYLPKVEPLGTPVITGVNSGERAVTVQWAANHDSHLAFYRLYRTGDETRASDVRLMDVIAEVAPGELDPAKEPEVLDRARLIGGQIVFYRLSIVDTDGNESQPSRTATAKVVDTTPPPAPSWDNQQWMLQRQRDNALAPWRSDGVVPDGYRAVLRLEWQSGTPGPTFEVSRRRSGERMWSAVAGSVRPSPNPRSFLLIDADADPTVETAYRLRVRSLSGVWSIDVAIASAPRPVPPAAVMTEDLP